MCPQLNSAVRQEQSISDLISYSFFDNSDVYAFAQKLNVLGIRRKTWFYSWKGGGIWLLRNTIAYQLEKWNISQSEGLGKILKI